MRSSSGPQAFRQAPPREEHDLHVRIWGEFREMPGLSLTLAQAARLFNLDRAQCHRVLADLVQSGALTTDGRLWSRADLGRHCA